MISLLKHTKNRIHYAFLFDIGFWFSSVVVIVAVVVSSLVVVIVGVAGSVWLFVWAAFFFGVVV